MIIYGTALLAVCHLLGIFLGDLLGQALGVKTNETPSGQFARISCVRRRRVGSRPIESFGGYMRRRAISSARS